jgi:hypothetical protein
MPNSELPGDVPGTSVSDSQGIVIGSGNQYNAWAPKPPLDPASLCDLNPHVAVARLQQLSHDELVDFFARASSDHVGEVLQVFFDADPSKLVAGLADVSRRKATELLAAVEVNLLDLLPAAADAIAREAARLRWTDVGPLESFTGGYARRYDNGRVIWSERFGVRVINAAIDEYLESGLKWGVPIGDQKDAQSSPYGTDGIRQGFQGGTVYSSKHGAFHVSDNICYKEEDASGGWLGFPIGESDTQSEFVTLQNFEGGTIYSYVKGGSKSFAVPREIANALSGDRRWRPISVEALAKSSSGKGGTLVYLDVEAESGTYETAVYWDEVNAPVVVAPEIWDYYADLNAEKSWLGFPVKDTFRHLRLGFLFQYFEGGVIYSRRETGPVSVPAEVAALMLVRNLGMPTSEEQPVGDSESHRIQYFENGVATLRNGKREIWLRPDPLPEPGKIPEPPVAAESRQNIE